MKTSVQIIALWISPGHDFKGRHGKGRLDHGMAPCQSVSCVAGKGIEGDRYFGFRDNFKGQITFFSEEVAAGLETALLKGSLDRSVMRRNVLIAGVDLNTLIGRRFRLGELVLTGSEECAPCYWMDEAVAPGAHAWLKGRGGLRCRIESGGILALGDTSLECLPLEPEVPCPV